ncbi:isopenicillin N synthase family dioxygenase [Azospirillum doebereinerae]|uniref:isopenicillin N synthase family dioxygenase n=1 Tax=Azospirillum doebereinerae TaxID=92933 RepID=UPI001EE5A57F|nr:2-oxoglutarate and iron-dependent oxygenase domain-containing protein [Azospirillum doebereinerae]MCG5243244.1 isopenicillin N synthase family oxygenase [Azospirillum doebereinerae]
MSATPSLAAAPALPLLDLSRFDGGGADRAVFLSELRAAIRRFGAFYVTGHGVDPAFLDTVFGLSRRFFDLPERDKLAIEMVHSPHFRGYTRAGWERTRGRADWREQVDIGSERPVLPALADAPRWTRLQGPNQWPDALPELRPAAQRLQDELTGVTLRLLAAVAVAIGLPEDSFAAIVAEEPTQLIKLIRYPGREVLPEDGDAAAGQGVGPHKDSGLLTLVLQHERSGLQAETAEGWVDVPPIPGTFVVNAGELLELATDGYFRAAVHQVVTPAAGTDRLSVAFFLGARLDARVPVLPLPPELAAEARGPERDPDNPLFHTVGENTLKSRLRSHPDVAQRHYADLLAAAV